MQLKRNLLSWLEITALFNLAVAYPVLDVLAYNWEFFTARKSSPFEIVLFVLILCIVLPLLLLLVENAAAMFGDHARTLTHTLILFVLISFLALASLRTVTIMPGTLLILLVVMLTMGVVAAYHRFRWMSGFFKFLAPSIVVVPAVFLMNPSISNLLFHAKIPPGPVIRSSTPVVVLIFDELALTSLLDASGQIDSVCYPNFARLANHSTWFRNATTVSDSTPQSVPAIQTGIYPTQTGFVGVPNLFTILGQSYELKVIESVTNSCPRQIAGYNTYKASVLRRMGFLMLDLSAIVLNVVSPHDFRERLPSLNNTWGNFWGQQTQGNLIQRFGDGAQMDAVEPFLKSIHLPEQRPTLYYLHVMLPHGPYEYFPSGHKYDHRFGAFSPSIVDGVDAVGFWKNNPWAVVQGFQRYLLQLGFTDKVLGSILDRLVETNIYDPSLIIVTSDHGVSFHAGAPRRDVTESNIDDIAPILLMMKTPYQKQGVISERNVETVDILPTILDLLRVKLPNRFDGRSLLENASPDRNQKRIYTKPRRHEGRYIYFHPTPIVRNAALQQRLSLFGARFAFENLFRIGDRKELLNRNIGEIHILQRSDVSVEIHNLSAFDNVQPAGKEIPAFITGRLHLPSDSKNPLLLLVTVNNIVKATTKSFPMEARQHGFGALVPEDSFHSGKNLVQIIVLPESESD